MAAPAATYRLQFHGGFPFDAAIGILGYLSDLGVTHVYASPYLQAAPGSTHGYDVVDPTRVNGEIGGEEGFVRFAEALARHGLKQILDIVPNHMAITGPENRWWADVLENGPSSQYASFFDVDWGKPEDRPSDRILLPILGDHYGRVLAAGDIRLARAEGRFHFAYHERRLPVAPRSLAPLLARAAATAPSELLGFLSDSLDALPHPSATDRTSTRRRHRDKEIIQDQLSRLLAGTPEVARAVDEQIERVNAQPDSLHEMLEEQNYRLAHWRLASTDLGYRRFFDVSGLIGLRTEDEAVFQETHRRVLEWIREGRLDGLRIDHPDGLRDPEEYLRRLRDAAPDAWITVEKILQPGEKLRRAWPVEGTTGYDALNLINGLFVDPTGEEPLTWIYQDFTGERRAFADVALEKKRLVLDALLSSDLNRLTELGARLCEDRRSYRDFSRRDLYDGIRELIAQLPVYRTYVRAEAGILAEEDRRLLNETVDRARAARPDLDAELFDLLQRVLRLEHRGPREAEFVMRFQQITGPAAAKGVEDTVLYAYNRLLSLNEVGGDPGRFGVTPEEFHRHMREAAERWPRSLTATATHDMKRGEDVRARLNVLSELPGEWAAAVRRWAQRNEPYRTDGAPDRNTEYLLYQTLAGAWPLDEERAWRYAEKAIREAKQHTSWTRVEPGFEAAVQRFLQGCLADDEFRRDLEEFVERIAGPGQANSVAQTLVKLTVPGAPDTYQGTELWDLSLVDPDNRHPVDFELRRRLLAELADLSTAEILRRAPEGLPKLWTVRQALRARRAFPAAFSAGAAYRELRVGGTKRDCVVAFLRGAEAATVAARFPLRVQEDWQDTAVLLPFGRWRNELTGAELRGGEIPLEELLGGFPAALVVRMANGEGERAARAGEGAEGAGSGTAHAEHGSAHGGHESAHESAHGEHGTARPGHESAHGGHGAARPAHESAHGGHEAAGSDGAAGSGPDEESGHASPPTARLRVWAPRARSVEAGLRGEQHALTRGDDGWWTHDAPPPPSGTGYGFSLDGGPLLPDPRSPWQPDGAAGLSRTLDAGRFVWNDARWTGGSDLRDGLVYQLHVGTFSPEGSFDGVARRLDHLTELGVTHVQLMPVATLPGEHDWGYDSAACFAPHEGYGGPDGLKRLVAACHARGISILLDVSYGHLGLEGSRLERFGPYLDDETPAPGGRRANLDGPESDEVRRFFCDNALHWLRDYRVDGLRLDAAHTLAGATARPFLEQLVAEVRELERALERRFFLIAESDRNEPRFVRPPQAGGFGLDAQWNDDFALAIAALLTGERTGRAADFGTIAHLAKSLRGAFVLDGVYSAYRRRRHGRPAGDLPGRRFLGYAQSHELAGTLAGGRRLCHVVTTGQSQIAAALVLTSPFVPMLFQGEEWAASTPFERFTDYRDPAQADAAREERRRELAAEGRNPESAPDPQDPEAFARSKLRWEELSRPPHRSMLDWHRSLVRLRRTRPELRDDRLDLVRATFDETERWLCVERGPTTIVCNLDAGRRRIPLPPERSRNVLLAYEGGLREDPAAVELAGESVVILGPGDAPGG